MKTTYQEIRQAKADKLDVLINECGMFFAFSDEQFEKNKTPLKEGEKYVSLGAGAYMPKSNVDKWINGQKEIENWAKNEIKNAKLEEAEILYELRNHEAFYTNDISDTVDVFQGKYTVEQIRKIYYKHLAEETAEF